jgi:predicted nucleotidyltransferase
VPRPNAPSKARSASLSTVGVTWFDSEAVRRALDAYVGTLVREHPEVDEVILFGSVATGTAVPGSDVDLLLVLSAADRPFLDRIPRFLPTGFPVGVDVFPYTRAEIECMRAEGNRFVDAAVCEGVRLFRRHA